MNKVLAFVYEDMADFEITLALNILGFNPDNEICLIAEEKNQ